MDASKEHNPYKNQDNATEAARSAQPLLMEKTQMLLQKPWFLGSIIVMALILVFGIAFSGVDSGSDDAFIFHTVTRSDLPIDITVSGNLESQENTEIICEVDDIRGDGVWGTPIVWVIENGASVKKGDLLMELNVTNHQERLDEQILDTEEARSRQIQSKVRYDNQITQNETALAEAELNVKLTELALEQYFNENGGTFQISMQQVDLQIKEAQASRLIEQTNLEGVEQLYKLGYRSSGELAQARLSYLRAERQLANALSQKKELEKYTYQKNKMNLEGKRASAKRALKQVKRDNEAVLKQAKATMEAAEESFQKETERLDRYKEQITKGRIYAPHDGMIAYRSSEHHGQRFEVAEGAAVRPQQHVMSLPGLSKMQVKTAVHESVLDQITKGLPATIEVNAFPGKTYRGTVQTVAVLPDQNRLISSDTKVYGTVVTIDEEVKQLKPGMTAIVEIHVDYLKDVASVPVQAIVELSDETWCYVQRDGAIERQPVAPGLTNDKFVEIKSGLKEGDRVILNTQALLDKTEEQKTKNASEPDHKNNEQKRQQKYRPPPEPDEEEPDEEEPGEEYSETKEVANPSDNRKPPDTAPETRPPST